MCYYNNNNNNVVPDSEVVTRVRRQGTVASDKIQTAIENL